MQTLRRCIPPGYSPVSIWTESKVHRTESGRERGGWGVARELESCQIKYRLACMCRVCCDLRYRKTYSHKHFINRSRHSESKSLLHRSLFSAHKCVRLLDGWAVFMGDRCKRRNDPEFIYLNWIYAMKVFKNETSFYGEQQNSLGLLRRNLSPGNNKSHFIIYVPNHTHNLLLDK